MLIAALPDALTWVAGASIFEQAQALYLERLCEAFGRRCGELRASDPATADQISRLWSTLDEGAVLRFLTAPEISRRLLWRGVDGDERNRFFLSALQAEALRAGQSAVRVDQEEIWTALGDEWYGPGGNRSGWPQDPAMMPLDFGSPYARRLDLTGAAENASVPRPGFTPEEIALVFAKLQRSFAEMQTAAPTAARFARQFNQVLVLQKDPTTPNTLASGSNGQYVGRSFLVNPEQEHATEAAITDAVIHEGIHALLYMQQLEAPWGPGAVLYDQTPRVVSPWTGRCLPLRSFLEASFVWYGLLHFWCLALGNEGFEPKRVQLFLRRALGGFLQRPLSSYLSDAASAGEIAAEVVDTVDALQARVCAAFGG